MPGHAPHESPPPQTAASSSASSAQAHRDDGGVDLFLHLHLVQPSETTSPSTTTSALPRPQDWISWWLPAALIAITAPLWLRGLVRRWKRPAQVRTSALLERLASAKHQQPSSPELKGTTDRKTETDNSTSLAPDTEEVHTNTPMAP